MTRVLDFKEIGLVIASCVCYSEGCVSLRVRMGDSFLKGAVSCHAAKCHFVQMKFHASLMSFYTLQLGFYLH